MSLVIESISSPQAKDLVRIFLRNQRSGVLATADGAGNPHATPIYYMYNDDFSILFATKRETQKLKNMEENKEVVLAIYDEPTQTVAQIIGSIEFVDDENVRERVIDNLHDASMERSGENISPPEKLEANGLVVVRIWPKVIKLAEYIYFSANDDNLFETILFSNKK